MAIPADGALFNLQANETSGFRADIKGKIEDERRAASTQDPLWAQTQTVATAIIDFDGLSKLSVNEWDTGIGRHKSSKHDSLHSYSRQHASPNTPVTTEVLIKGELQCSVAEAAALLHCPSEGDFNATMATVYGRSFQHGSVIHSFDSAKREVHNEPLQADFLAPYQCVKTAAFARPRLALLGHDERWCFIEQFAPLTKNLSPSQDGFTLSQRSLRPSELPQTVCPPIEVVRRRHGSDFTKSCNHTHQLLGLSLGCSIEVISCRQPAAVRFVFYGCHSSEGLRNSTLALRRMKRLARGILKLPDIIRRRRFSAQVPAYAWFTSQSAPSTSLRCVSCSNTLHSFLMVKKSRCYLCAHFVCSRCWIRQPVETINGRSISVLVCPHCLLSVQSCNYAHLAASSISDRASNSSVSTSSRWSASEPQAEPIVRTAQVLPDADTAPEPGHAVVSYLENILSDKSEADSPSEDELVADPSTTTRAQTAANVLQQLTSVLDEGINRVMAHCFWLSDHNGNRTSKVEPDVLPSLHKLQAQFAREVLPMEACILSNAVIRGYTIDTSSGGKVSSIPVGPIPPNEIHRLGAITQERLLSVHDSDELNLICELATQELSCMTALVTIVGRSLQYVLASNSPRFRNAELPREHTLCQHLLMGDRPMLVRHPEADVRFCNLSLVMDFGIQFYAGFPIFSSDGLSVVGSLCCLDMRSREMTQSQYSTLLHLTRVASNIITDQSRHLCTLKPLQKRRDAAPRS